MSVTRPSAITLTELRYLVALDKERHFGRAADRCFVSQPTLSVAIRKLEEQLGITLFERNRSEARPTPVGERIIEQARRVLAEAAALEAIAQQGQDELNGVLRLGVIYTVGPYLLPRLVPRLRDAVPSMPLLIEENFTAVLSRQLRQNELDVIIIALPFGQPSVDTWPLYDEPFVVVMPKNHPWSARRSIPPNDLSAENLLLLGPGHCFREQVLDACPDCREAEGELPRPLAGSSLETIRHMVASGLGITVLPKSSVEESAVDSALLSTRPFTGQGPSRRIALAWRRSFPRPKAIAALRAAILACELKGVHWLKGEQPNSGQPETPARRESA
jgi:LysR family transcriptional regulator, hydrogen peroxide-inducible genes activator